MCVTVDGVWIGEWIYWQNLELQVIMALSLISTIHKSPQHPLSLSEPVVSSLAVPWQRLQTVEILQFHALRSSCHNRQCRIPLNCQLNWVAPIVILITPFARTHIEITQFPTVSLLLRAIRFRGNMFTEPLLKNSRCLFAYLAVTA
jgi:hypothetical protein